MPRERDRRLLFWSTIAGVGIRLAVNLLVHPPERSIFSDMAVYDEMARSILSGRPSPWDGLQPPGYPVLLALVYGMGDPRFLALAILQALLGAGSALFAGLLAQSLGASGRASAVAAAIVALHAPSVFYGALLMSEIPTAFFLTLSIWLVAGGAGPARLMAAAIGLTLGLASLLRPNCALLFAVVPPVFFVTTPDRRHAADRTVVTAIAAFLVLGPACWVNSIRLGRVSGLSANGGVNFYLSFAPIRGVVDGKHSVVPVRNATYYEQIVTAPVPVTDEPFFYRQGLELLGREPSLALSALLNVADGLGLGRVRYWPANHVASPPTQRGLTAFLRLFTPLFLLPTVVVGLSSRYHRRTRVLAAGLVGSLLVPLYLFLGDPRLHIPFVPALAAFAALGLDRVWLSLEQRRLPVDQFDRTARDA